MLINFFDKAMILKVIGAILLSNIKVLGAFVPISLGIIEKEDDIKKKFFLYIISAVTVTLRFSVMTALSFISGIVILNIIERIIFSFKINNKNFLHVAMFSSIFLNDIIWNMFDSILLYDVIIAAIKGISTVLGYMLFSSFK